MIVAPQHDHVVHLVDQHDESASEDIRSVPFLGLSSSDDLGDSPRRQSFSGFSTPLTSPKLSSLDTSDEFGVGGIGSPGSPPPFAVRNAKQHESNNGTAVPAVSSPFRWENLLNESAYSSPVLKSPPHSRFRAKGLPHGPRGEHFGAAVDDEAKLDASQGSHTGLPSGVMSPRIIHGTQVRY